MRFKNIFEKILASGFYSKCRVIVSGKPLGYIKELNENLSLISPLFLSFSLSLSLSLSLFLLVLNDIDGIK